MIHIKLLNNGDAKELLKFLIKNKEYISKYDFIGDDNYYTLQYQLNNISLHNNRKYNIGCKFGVFNSENNLLIGTVDIYNIIRGCFNSGTIGYIIDEDYAGKGLATQSVKFAIDYAFNLSIDLHRLEAYAMPENIASNRVLEKSGFQLIGVSKHHYFIHNRWNHFNIYSITKEMSGKSK